MTTIFGATLAGGVFLPMNPLLKPPQVGHILHDCAVRVLVTTAKRAGKLAKELAQCPKFRTLIVVDVQVSAPLPGKAAIAWEAFLASGSDRLHRVIDTDMVAILYTSGSTGKRKGVVLSHKNMVTGARSVAQYLENRADDRLPLLPRQTDATIALIEQLRSDPAFAVLMGKFDDPLVGNSTDRSLIIGPRPPFESHQPGVTRALRARRRNCEALQDSFPDPR